MPAVYNPSYFDFSDNDERTEITLAVRRTDDLLAWFDENEIDKLAIIAGSIGDATRSTDGTWDVTFDGFVFTDGLIYGSLEVFKSMDSTKVHPVYPHINMRYQYSKCTTPPVSSWLPYSARSASDGSVSLNQDTDIVQSILGRLDDLVEKIDEIGKIVSATHNGFAGFANATVPTLQALNEAVLSIAEQISGMTVEQMQQAEKDFQDRLNAEIADLNDNPATRVDLDALAADLHIDFDEEDDSDD